MILSWNQVVATVPDVFGRLLKVVESDHQWDPKEKHAPAVPGGVQWEPEAVDRENWACQDCCLETRKWASQNQKL